MDNVNIKPSDLYSTQDFKEAIYLYKSGVIFVSIEWDDPQRASFVFKQPPDEILSSWQRGDDAGVRPILDAAEFLRRKLNQRNR
jgi:hypothetical protein